MWTNLPPHVTLHILGLQWLPRPWHRDAASRGLLAGNLIRHDLGGGVWESNFIKHSTVGCQSHNDFRTSSLECLLVPGQRPEYRTWCSIYYDGEKQHWISSCDLWSCLRTWRCSQILVPAEDQAPECSWVCADGHPRESRPQAFSRGQILKLGWSSQGFDSFSASLEGFSAWSSETVHHSQSVNLLAEATCVCVGGGERGWLWKCLAPLSYWKYSCIEKLSPSGEMCWF